VRAHPGIECGSITVSVLEVFDKNFSGQRREYLLQGFIVGQCYVSAKAHSISPIFGFCRLSAP
jgi:hypothetical protein